MAVEKRTDDESKQADGQIDLNSLENGTMDLASS